MIKPKYGEKTKLLLLNTHSYIVYIKTDDIQKDVAEYAETRFGTSSYELDRLLPKRKSKKVTGLMKDESSGKIMTKLVRLRAGTYGFLIDNHSKDKKPKSTKKCVIKRKLSFEHYTNCLEAN